MVDIKDNKGAVIEALRGDDFFLVWENKDGTFLTVEYIPANWPWFTLIEKDDRAKEEIVRVLEEMGYEIRN